VASRRPESVTVELPTPRQEMADDLGLINGVREIALGVEHRPFPRVRAAEEGRGDIAATPMASGTCAWSIDNLELREFGDIFSANSVPMPDCLAPPYGICGAISRCLLIHTVPASIRVATS
jgi:hypothetical protein